SYGAHKRRPRSDASIGSLLAHLGGRSLIEGRSMGIQLPGLRRDAIPARAVHFKKFSPMGTQIRFLGWNRPAFRHPSFPTLLSMAATSSTTLGRSPASLHTGYGSTHRSIASGAPFWEGASRQRP